ncbi:MAG: hypothetical protein WDM85_18290 [Caulobacteraceae bacterium]
MARHLGGDRFELDDAGHLLRSDTPGSVRGMALHWGVRLGARSASSTRASNRARRGQPQA